MLKWQEVVIVVVYVVLECGRPNIYVSSLKQQYDWSNFDEVIRMLIIEFVGFYNLSVGIMFKGGHSSFKWTFQQKRPNKLSPLKMVP